jgi:hypothetical protein
MELRFYIDPETREPHIYRHAVSEDEVEEVLEKPQEDRRGERIHASPWAKPWQVAICEWSTFLILDGAPLLSLRPINPVRTL